MKFLAFIAALFLSFSPAPALAQHRGVISIAGDAFPSPYFIDLSLVRRIVCVVPGGFYIGSGVFVSGTDMVTAYHVVEVGKCSMEGAPLKVVYTDKARDFAVVRTPDIKSRVRITVSCSGFVEGADYFGVGYARGTDFAVQRFTGTKDRVASRFARGMSVLRGQSFHGQSGGAVIDRDGRLVGIVNAGPEDGTPFLLSLPMSLTYLCVWRPKAI